LDDVLPGPSRPLLDGDISVRMENSKSRVLNYTLGKMKNPFLPKIEPEFSGFWKPWEDVVQLVPRAGLGFRPD